MGEEGDVFSGRVQISRQIEQTSVSRCGKQCRVFRENTEEDQSVRTQMLGILSGQWPKELGGKGKATPLVLELRKASKLSTENLQATELGKSFWG